MSNLKHDTKNINFLSEELKRVAIFNSNPELQVSMLTELIQELNIEVEKTKLRIIHM